MFKYFLELFLIGIIGWVIGIPSGASGWAGGAAVAGGILGFLAFFYGVLIVGPIDYGVSFAHLKAARGDKLQITDMFQVFQNYWNAVLASILVSIIIFIGFVLLIIPGIIFACKLAFTPYLVVDQKMDVMEAIKGSWNMTRGHAWKVFFIGLLAIPIVIVGLVLFIIGIIPAIMWIKLTFASLYHAVSLSKA
ncbi:glycerophosphoryl diester phosphodiesterase membrane domain-containing protein [Chloroflexota bacterium]